MNARWRFPMAAALAVPWALSIASPGRLAASGDEVAEILAAGALAQTRNPVVANFLLEEGGALLSASERAQALEQSSTALRGQTNFMALTMQGIGGMMSSDSMRDAQESARKMMSPRSLLLAAAGIGPAMAAPAAGQMESEMKQAMTDPWVRGIAAAQALESAGEVQAAARFYVNCLQLLQAEWVPDACLEGIVALGPESNACRPSFPS